MLKTKEYILKIENNNQINITAYGPFTIHFDNNKGIVSIHCKKIEFDFDSEGVKPLCYEDKQDMPKYSKNIYLHITNDKYYADDIEMSKKKYVSEGIKLNRSINFDFHIFEDHTEDDFTMTLLQKISKEINGIANTNYVMCGHYKCSTVFMTEIESKEIAVKTMEI